MHLITTPIHCQKFRRFRLRHKLLLYLGMGCLFNKQTNQPQIFSSSVCCMQSGIKRGNFFSSSLPSASLSPLTSVSPTLTSSSSPQLAPCRPAVPQFWFSAGYPRIWSHLSGWSSSAVGITCFEDENTFLGSECFYHQPISSLELRYLHPTRRWLKEKDY